MTLVTVLYSLNMKKPNMNLVNSIKYTQRARATSTNIKDTVTASVQAQKVSKIKPTNKTFNVVFDNSWTSAVNNLY